MSGDMLSGVTLTPVVEALQGAISPTDIVTLFASGVKVALPLILVWFGCKWVYKKFTRATKGGRD